VCGGGYDKEREGRQNETDGIKDASEKRRRMRLKAGGVGRKGVGPEGRLEQRKGGLVRGLRDERQELLKTMSGQNNKQAPHRNEQQEPSENERSEV
jgi:hypothetical protein